MIADESGPRPSFEKADSRRANLEMDSLEKATSTERRVLDVARVEVAMLGS
jgi:hypothetical protein